MFLFLQQQLAQSILEAGYFISTLDVVFDRISFRTSTQDCLSQGERDLDSIAGSLACFGASELAQCLEELMELDLFFRVERLAGSGGYLSSAGHGGC